MKRCGFLASLLAPFLARFFPAPAKPFAYPLGVDVNTLVASLVDRGPWSFYDTLQGPICREAYAHLVDDEPGIPFDHIYTGRV